MSKFDFIAIGDITTDVFIRIKEAHVNCQIDRQNCQICMRFGDKIPYESATVVSAVGNSPNATVSATRLGLSSAVVTNIGEDEHGREDLATLKKNGVETSLVKVNPGKSSNYHYVLWYEDDRTILIKHEEFDYELPTFEPPRFIYLSSLGENSLPFHHTIAEYIKNHPETKLVFQPGTFQIKLGAETLKDIYAVTEIFFCNVEEARRIIDAPEDTVADLLSKVHELGPKIVVITDGPKGAYCFDGTTKLFMPIYPDPKPPLERTGAGDSFASTFTAMIALGKSVEEALTLAPINSMNVVQHVGAQAGLLTMEQIQDWLTKAPADYKAQII
ncbi:MAG: carbohydrate kinase family protein [Candidatus Vogelbacteria bacterium]|nr:carbohydrate kinase family protein [Candidatus Vogelbacteria bacterium]